MRIQISLMKVKRWHWAVIAIAMGIAFAFTHVSPLKPVGIRSVTLGEFKRQVQQKPWSGRAPFVDNVIVHPIQVKAGGNKVELVTMARWAFDNRGNRWINTTCAFESPVPFAKGASGSGIPNPISVMTFLEQVSSTRSGLSYHYAWWERPIALYGIAVAAALLLIAGILPAIIQTAAFASNKAAGIPVRVSAAAIHADDVASKAVVTETDHAPVLELSTKPLAPIPITEQPHNQRYAGEFYPVTLPSKGPQGPS